MTTSAVGWGEVPDRGLSRMLDLTPAAARRQIVRRWAGAALLLVAGLGAITATFVLWPDESTRPVLPLSFAATLVGVGVIGLSIVVSLTGLVTTSRAGLNPFGNYDPLRNLPRVDRAWVRARIQAGAPVAPPHQALVIDAASWMARQPAATPFHLGLALFGLGILLGSPGIASLLVGLVLVVEGVILTALALQRARGARVWLSLYSQAPTP